MKPRRKPDRSGEDAFLISKSPRVEDEKYRQSFRGRACEACGIQDETIIPAHVRKGQEGGTGYKPDDALIVALCFKCHADQEAHPGYEWWCEKIFKRWLRNRYEGR